MLTLSRNKIKNLPAVSVTVGSQQPAVSSQQSAVSSQQSITKNFVRYLVQITSFSILVSIVIFSPESIPP